MSTEQPQDLSQPGAPVPGHDALEDLVGEWLAIPDVAQRLGVRLTDVRRMIEEGDLVAVRVGERRVLQVPAAFVDDDGPLPALRGTFTVLRDARMSDDEVVAWLFARDETLPGGATTAIEAIRAGFKTEVRRRAMEEAL
ncbi:Rv2175c family DNA-binding protein [Janibacter sp. Y6]|uniref:Rv2175c family DNA-binding protein n=1 Tax=Janibacter sp. Y6 TaxID=2913552 RepID=UPI0034A30B0C